MNGTGAGHDGIPAPGGQPPAPGAPPPGHWPQAPPPTKGNGTLIVAGVLAGVVLLLACCGLSVFFFAMRTTRTVASSLSSAAPVSPGGRPSAQPGGSTLPAEQGPQASGYAAEKPEDLNRVCDDDVYYPQSPKRAGKAPHPVVLLIDDGSGHRFQNSTYHYDEGLSKRAEQTWAAQNVSKVQLVACLDRVATGAKIRSCKYDDPEPETVTLLRAGWRLRVYETATGRKLLDKSLDGDDRACPALALIGPDKKIYAEVSNRAVVAALRGLVTR